MPQAVPNLLTIPDAPRFKPAAPPPNPQPSQAEGQSFKDTLGRVKDRSPRQSDDADDDKQPTKAQHKKPARQAKQADQSSDAPQAKAKGSKSKDAPAGQDAQSQSDDSGQQTPQEGQKQPKQQPDSASAHADATDTAQLAAVVQVQAPVASKAEPNASPDAPKETSAPKKPAAVGRVRSETVQAKPQKANASGDPSDKSKEDAAADGEARDGAPQDADQPQIRASTAPENAQAMESKGSKPPLLAAKQDPQAPAASDDDPSQDSAALASVVAMMQTMAGDSDQATQPAVDAVAGSKSGPKNASGPDDGTTPIAQPDPSRGKSPGAAFRVETAADPAPAAPPEAQFAEANHAKIVGAIHGQLLPNGGSMHIRLDPPELGALNVRVEMRDGVMTAAFETTNDQATKLLSHSLGDLKAALEAQGVSVEKLHVRQSDQQHSSGEDRPGTRQQDSAAQREQQRRDLMRRMWRRLMKGQDPLDLVA